MKKKGDRSKTFQFVRGLCKGKTEAELQEAEYNFRGYLMIVKKICDRLEQEGKDLPDFDDQ